MTGKDDLIRKGTETTNLVAPIVETGSASNEKKFNTMPLTKSIIVLKYIKIM